ncbi:Histidine kinase [Pedobacter caeni]|uniref:Histidine kinase n=2 Tax=Pedobacter caeni TaxID=288992 RepID=A0A1M5NG05_9SPHI|nr:Histidine kinase [Pedobacter caeni]
MLINILVLLVILRLSFEKRIIESILRKQWQFLLTVQHVLFWLCFSFVTVYFYTYFVGFPNSLFRAGIALLINAAIYYLVFNYFVPAFYVTKKYALYIFYTMLVFVLVSLLRILTEPGIDGFSFIFIYTSQVVVILTASLLGISKHKFIIENDIKALEIVKKEADLNLIKSKINPHFLLNTLNNIYAAGNHTEDLQSQSVLNLSQLLQYTIYETAHQRISFATELQMIKSLTGLYQLKYDHQLDIQLDLPTSDWIEDVEIPPTVCFTLYENALKYAAIGHVPGAWIRVNANLDDKGLHFSLINSIAHPEQVRINDDYKGIGIATIRQLLNLEFGPEKYSLTTSIEKETHLATLIIQL